VAISRAKFGLAIVCDPRAVINDPHWAACVAYAACLGGMVIPSDMEMPLPGSDPEPESESGMAGGEGMDRDRNQDHEVQNPPQASVDAQMPGPSAAPAAALG